MGTPAADLETVMQRVLADGAPGCLPVAWALAAVVVNEDGEESMLWATAPRQCVATTTGLHDLAHQHYKDKYRRKPS